MTWKRGFYAALALLVASNLWWLYMMVDHAVTDTYAQVSAQETADNLAVMKRLAPEADVSRREVLDILRRTHPDALIVDDSTGVSMGGLRFEFRDERLVRVGEFGK